MRDAKTSRGSVDVTIEHTVTVESGAVACGCG